MFGNWMSDFSCLCMCVSVVQLLEACVKNCGKRFHQELGKFRFLNEMIRSISPKVNQPWTTVTIIIISISTFMKLPCTHVWSSHVDGGEHGDPLSLRLTPPPTHVHTEFLQCTWKYYKKCLSMSDFPTSKEPAIDNPVLINTCCSMSPEL